MINYTFHIVHFKDITSWSVSQQKEHDFGYTDSYPLVAIGRFLCRNKTSIDILDGKKYKRLSIHSKNGGIEVRDEIDGRKIGTKKQFVVRAGQFALSKIDARNGAFGVVPKDADGAIITGNFWTFDVDYSLINTSFLALLTTTESFLKFSEMASNGTTNRHYLQEKLFLEQRIPLPSLEEQNNIIDKYNCANAIIEQHKQQINSEIISFYSYFEKILGLSNQIQQSHNVGNLQFISFKEMTNWGVSKLVNNRKSPLNSSKYQVVELGQLAEINPKTDISTFRETDSFTFIPMEDISAEDGSLINNREIKKAKVKGYTKFQNGDIIWARITPCMQNGKSAVLNGLINGKGCGSTEFHVIRVRSKQILEQYVHLLLRYEKTLKYAQQFFTGSAGQQRVPASFLSSLRIPVPPIAIQEEIISHYLRIIDLKMAFRQKVEQEIRNRDTNFEKTIFA